MSILTLIVEDDPMVSKINEEYLNKVESFQLVGTVKNGEEALQEMKEKNPDLLLLDIFMPKLNGLELLRKIRLENIRLDVILITAADSPEMIEDAMRLGVVDCILKPFDFKRFQSALLYYKRRYSLFQSSKTLNQNGLDTLQVTNEQSEELLPKGIDKVTLSLVRDTLKEADCALSIHELSNLINISNLTIRKYIEYLTQQNEVQLDLNYKKKGRPTKLYSYHK